ncbi:NPC intracellular cholesterol transporter 1 isoform X1 [Lepeophtheirus salmonis]|uniref:NPC intracellular cholesterol transporter 1 isoform X1 n=2 Tax=Lepeophtheirus salmonis TaxID=72036 RepID=UPI001AE40A44|nr:NPC intracellular cholesterol transporter 1-like isoform X1 [Lepeophtheirus salmonis]
MFAVTKSFLPHEVMYFKTILFILILNTYTLFVNGDCIWYDQCGFDPNDTVKSFSLNCKYEGVATKAKEKDFIDILRLTCPHLEAEALEQGLCCSISQMKDLLSNFKIPEIMFGRCPICLMNFKKYFCDMTCHPDQSNFLKIIETVKLPSTEIELVKTIEYSVNEDFIKGIFDSCYEVNSPQTSSRVMKLVCGKWGDKLCTPLRWFSYLGDRSNGRTPIQINVKPLTEGGHSPTVPHCDSSNATVQSCACLDCKQACPKLDADEYKEILTLKNEYMNFPLAYSVLIVILLLILLVGIFLIAIKIKAKNRISSETQEESRKESIGWLLFQTFFRKLGYFCSKYAVYVLICNGIIFIVLSSGVFWLKVTSEPIELWSSTNSRSRKEMDFFNEHFEPFFRTSILIIRPSNESFLQKFKYNNLYGKEATFSGIFRQEMFYQVLKLQKEIEKIITEDKITLQDVCYKPLAPEIPSCLLQSVWNYWQGSNSSFNLNITNDRGHQDTYLDHLTTCVENPFTIKSSTAMGQSCLSKGFVPLEAKFVMGGFKTDKSPESLDSEDILANTSALIMTFLLQNHIEKDRVEKAIKWEKSFVKWIESNLKNFPLLDIAFIAEMSIQDAIESNSHGDVLVVIISYFLMFVYVSFALTDFRNKKYFGITLAIAGIFMVLGSILSTTGLFGFIGVKATMIIFEIVPFLVLAVGIDNIFVLVLTARRKLLSLEGREMEVDSLIGITLEEIAPAMLISTLTQTCAFYLGTLSKMPAVVTFALYAGTSLLINFLAQITGFIAILSLDLKRIKSKKLDLFCCLSDKGEIDVDNPKSRFNYQKTISTFFEKYVSPMLMKKLTVKFSVMVLIAITLSITLVFTLNIPVGLDPESTMPKGSYVKKYFEWLKLYYSVGPPVYFVVNSTNMDLATVKSQNRICGSAGCDPYSFQTAMKLWSTKPDLTTLATSGQSWIDDYFSWSNDCCMVDSQGKICSDKSPDYASLYSYDYTDYDSLPQDIACTPCSDNYRVNGSSFKSLLPLFLHENPNESCPKGGKIYKKSIDIKTNKVLFSNFMAFHTVLRTSNDFVQAIESTRILSDKFARENNITSFPYSIFHVYYEQYLSMKTDTLVSIAYVLLTMLLICWFLSGKIVIGLYTVTFVSSILIHVTGFISMLGIQLNAILAVNLLVACGISVEICIGYLTSVIMGKRSAEEVYNDQAGILMSGIHITNLIGVSVLGFSQSNIFFYYFFTVYISIVVIGFVHGLIVLPVLLSFFY